MVRIPKSAVSAGIRPVDVTAASADTQLDAEDRLAELARNASPEERARLERMIDGIVQSRRAGFMILKAIQQLANEVAANESVALVAESHIMDEERRSLAELQITDGRSSG